MKTNSNRVSVEQFLNDTEQTADNIHTPLALYVGDSFRWCSDSASHFDFELEAYIQNGWDAHLVELTHHNT